MKNKGLIATIVVLIAVIITLIAVLVLVQMPTILSSDGIASKILNNKNETSVISTAETTENNETSINETTEEVVKLSTRIENYTAHNGRVSIDYPKLVGMSDSSFEEKMNNKIKTNALSIVPLYPISTSVQNLTISCEVKRLDEDFITIVYEGRVVGDKLDGSSTPKTSSSTKKSTQAPDPYLDGFVDPLTIFGQNNFQINSAPVANYVVESSTSARTEITYNTNVNNNVNPGVNNTGTADKGPVTTEIKAPTAPAQNSSITADNVATNNPTGNPAQVITNNYSSNGVYYSQSGSQVAPTETSSYNSTIYSLPVSGFVNTNASDIDQKIYYTNTINLKTGLDMKLGDYVSDFDALSKYLRSSKVEFANIDESNRKAVREYVNKTIQSRYVEQMESADFRNEGVKSWPKIFSYIDTDGTVYFSVKLSSKLGNYAIVKYKK